ncbi:Hypothetical_protein [Hexamita inflata]|uniref:Hypothetical_protein n=1 Tax=Hexamita inflata TaxID=28002 RepID=A0AA86RLK9_9EUKA|nr:Hypothetical protein HINF_LOCUS63488 [Hexamita inflata]
MQLIYHKGVTFKYVMTLFPLQTQKHYVAADTLVPRSKPVIPKKVTKITSEVSQQCQFKCRTNLCRLRRHSELQSQKMRYAIEINLWQRYYVTQWIAMICGMKME